MNKFIVAAIAVLVLLSVSGCRTTPASIPATAVPLQSPIPLASLPPASSTQPGSPGASATYRGELTYQNAPVTITKESNGSEVRVNLVKFVGALGLFSEVKVNNKSMTVNPDSSYYVFLDLIPGENKIKVLTKRFLFTTADIIEVTFDPPVAVYLKWPGPDSPTYINQNPFQITGFVTNSKAAVAVNGYDCSVNNDGTFSVQIPETSSVVAVAKFGSETDTDSMGVDLTRHQMAPISPGFGIFRMSSAGVSPDTVNLHPGEATNIDLTLAINKESVDVDLSKAVIKVVRVDSTNPGQLLAQRDPGLPMIPDLIIEQPESGFIPYSYVNYHLAIGIKTNSSLAPGTYYLAVLINARFSTVDVVTVNVAP